MHGHRNGIALMTAIAFLLIMATIMGLMLSMSSQSSKRGADLYFQEQAHMLAKSATEFALLAISGHNRAATDNCVNQISSTYGGIYDINTTIRYIGNGLPASPDCTYLNYNGSGAPINDITTNVSNGTVIIDVYVTLQAGATTMSEDIRFHRRTMQKP